LHNRASKIRRTEVSANPKSPAASSRPQLTAKHFPDLRSVDGIECGRRAGLRTILVLTG